MKILITGGAGYIGSHTTLELAKLNYEITIADNLSNSSLESINRIKEITKKDISFKKLDLRDEDLVEELFSKNKFDAVIHFAGLKAVGESVKNPLEYYSNNISSTLNLLKAMGRHNVKTIVFSSSATVYGDPTRLPILETSRLHATNPYGRSKLMIEQILKDLADSKKGWKIISLRYFNPIGAHDSGEIGEDPNGTPNNLLPYISQVAIGKLKKLLVYGNNYSTPDGTGVRDYIHVTDLAKAHVAALGNGGLEDRYKAYNIGTGKGTSVLEMIKYFEKVSSRKIAYNFTKRRSGDIAECYADPSLAQRELGWSAHKTILEACEDSWRWQSKNPNGYSD